MDILQRVFSTPFGPSSVALATVCAQNHAPILRSIPAAYSDVSAVMINENLAVIPGQWQNGDTSASFYDTTSQTDPCVTDAFSHIKAADFVAWDESFFPIIGSNAKLETIHTFTPDAYHVHEAPVYIPETNELLYSDTSVVGHLWAINIDSHQTRQITTNPPLHNVNGGTYHDGEIYLATNGGPTRGIHKLNHTTGATTPILNNFRGRHFNSPNDLIFDARGNLYFTDPPYGHLSRWPGVPAPELPPAIYRFEPHTHTLTTVWTAGSGGVVSMPNGLALASSPPQGRQKLYVADSASTSGAGDAQRAVWAFDVLRDGGLCCPRLVYQVDAGWPDGLRVTAGGWLMVAVTGGVDVVDPATGRLLGRVNTPGDVVFNLEPARGKGVWLLTGKKRIYKLAIREAPAEDSWATRVRGQVMGLVESLWKYQGL